MGGGVVLAGGGVVFDATGGEGVGASGPGGGINIKMRATIPTSRATKMAPPPLICVWHDSLLPPACNKMWPRKKH